MSGAKGREFRKHFDALLKAAARREFDIIAAWSVDRLGRSLQDLLGFLREIHALGVDLFLHQQEVDTTTPAGKAMFQMLGAFAEFERELIRERVNAGLTRAKARGKRLGRPPVADIVEAQIRTLRATGKGQRVIARELHPGVSVVQRVAGRVATCQPPVQGWSSTGDTSRLPLSVSFTPPGSWPARCDCHLRPIPVAAGPACNDPSGSANGRSVSAGGRRPGTARRGQLRTLPTG